MVDQSRRRFVSRQKIRSTPRLPWCIDEDEFLNHCDQCQKCLLACETKIITLGSGEYPEVNVHLGDKECTFCYACADACPKSLFYDKHNQPWTVVASMQDNCLAKHQIECRSCSDICEPQAIQFKPSIGMSAQPQLNSELCTGCGACVSSCPTDAIHLVNKNLKKG